MKILKKEQTDIKSSYYIENSDGLIKWSQLNDGEPFLMPNGVKNFTPIYRKKVFGYGTKDACFFRVSTVGYDYYEPKSRDWAIELDSDFLIQPLSNEQFEKWCKGTVSL